MTREYAFTLAFSCKRQKLQPTPAVLLTLDGGSVPILVLVFAASRKEMALRFVLYNPIRKTKCRNCQIICRNRKK